MRWILAVAAAMVGTVLVAPAAFAFGNQSSIVGTVTGPSGPAVGVSVELSDDGSPQYPTAIGRTEATGRYRIDHVFVGRYHVLFEPYDDCTPGYARYPSSSTRAGSRSAHVPDDGTATAAGWGDVFPSATNRSASDAVDGNYTLGGLLPGDIDVPFDTAGVYRPQFDGANSDPASATPMHPAAGETKTVDAILATNVPRRQITWSPRTSSTLT